MSGLRGWVVRRLLVLPVLVVLSPVLAGAWVLTVLLSAVLCPVAALLTWRSPRWRAVRLSSMVLLHIVGELCCVAACFVLWVACGARLTRPWVVKTHRRVLRLFLGALLRAAAPAFGFRLEVDEPQRHPDDLALVNGDRPLVVLARHAGPGASFALVHVLLGRWSRQVHVILKDTLRLDPAIDLLLTRTGCTWVPTSGARRSTPDAVAAAAQSLAAADALLLFPEGADWTPARHLAAVSHLRRRGKWREAQLALRMPHVLPPRPAGAAAAIRNRRDAEVLIFTHTGHDQLLDAASTWAALPLRDPLHMAWWRIAPELVPDGDDDTISAWLQEVWRDIDSWIEEQTALANLQQAP